MNSSLKNKKICFIGAGSMAEALTRGLIEQEKAHANHLFIVNRQNHNRIQELHKRYGIQSATHTLKNKFIQDADIVVLAMKPKNVVDALHQLKPLLHENQLLISVVAGLTINTITSIINKKLPIVRTMPNTSCSIGFGATGICFSEDVLAEHQELAMDIFQSVGMVSIIEEQQMDIVTGLSGSGPAYIYYMIEAMIEAGIEGGLIPEQAEKLTLQTVLGAVQMVKMTNEKPALLRQKVTSPGGSTQAAIEVLDQNLFTIAVKKAVLRSAERAAEMGAAIPMKSE